MGCASSAPRAGPILRSRADATAGAAVETRRLGPADADAIAREIARAIKAGDLLASSDPAGVFILKVFGHDPGQFAGAFEGDELVGFVSPEFKVAVVRPDHRRRGVGRTLVDVGVELTSDKGYPELLLGVLPGDAAGSAFLTATGLSYHSTVWDLDLPHDRALPAPSWPAGHIGRSFDRTRDLEAWVRVFNDAFADHPTPLQLQPTAIAAGLGDPDNEDADTVVVEETASGALVGFCATDPTRRNGAIGTHGELWAIGVRPDRQGHGLGRQLVRAGVERLRSIGIRDVSLSVNGRNESALGLYESEGFVRSRTRDRWSRPVKAAAEPGP